MPMNEAITPSPYPPFSEEMRKKVDVLSIIRAWQFTSSDQGAYGYLEIYGVAKGSTPSVRFFFVRWCRSPISCW